MVEFNLKKHKIARFNLTKENNILKETTSQLEVSVKAGAGCYGGVD